MKAAFLGTWREVRNGHLEGDTFMASAWLVLPAALIPGGPGYATGVRRGNAQ